MTILGTYALTGVPFKWDPANPNCSSQGQYNPAKICPGTGSMYLDELSTTWEAGGANWHITPSSGGTRTSRATVLGKGG